MVNQGQLIAFIRKTRWERRSTSFILKFVTKNRKKLLTHFFWEFDIKDTIFGSIGRTCIFIRWMKTLQ